MPWLDTGVRIALKTNCGISEGFSSTSTPRLEAFKVNSRSASVIGQWPSMASDCLTVALKKLKLMRSAWS